MTGRKRCDRNLRLIDGASAPPEAPVQLGAGPHFLTSRSSPAGQVRFDPSLRTAADQMAEQLGGKGWVVAPELVVAELVRAWVGDMLPGNSDAEDRAVAVAARCLAAGASVTEVAEEVSRFLRSWAAHPSSPGSALRVAS